MIYLDYAANTPADPAVLQVFNQVEQRCIGNSNSSHSAGRAAREILEQAMRETADALGVAPEEVIFTSGASESNNLALKGIARTCRHSGKHILSTFLEHSSTSGTLTALQEQGYEVELAEILRDGTIYLEHLRELLRKDTILVAVSWVDGELGTIQPIREIVSILKEYPNCRLHVDATQAVGKVPVFLEGIDTLALAPHKFYGLNGCGVLVKKREVVLEPLIHGGTGVSLYRGGTPPVALAAATAKALSMAVEGMEERRAHVEALLRRLTNVLKNYPLVHINSPNGASPYILNLSVKGVKAETFRHALDEKGVCVSVKSACSVAGTPSRAVYAVAGDRKNATWSWRISLSHLTTGGEIDEFLAIFDECYKELTQ